MSAWGKGRRLGIWERLQPAEDTAHKLCVCARCMVIAILALGVVCQLCRCLLDSVQGLCCQHLGWEALACATRRQSQV